MLNCFSQQNLINKESDEENSEEKESDDKEISETKIKEIIEITANDDIKISLLDNIISRSNNLSSKRENQINEYLKIQFINIINNPAYLGILQTDDNGNDKEYKINMKDIEELYKDFHIGNDKNISQDALLKNFTLGLDSNKLKKIDNIIDEKLTDDYLNFSIFKGIFDIPKERRHKKDKMIEKFYKSTNSPFELVTKSDKEEEEKKEEQYEEQLENQPEKQLDISKIFTGDISLIFDKLSKISNKSLKLDIDDIDDINTYNINTYDVGTFESIDSLFINIYNRLNYLNSKKIYFEINDNLYNIITTPVEFIQPLIVNDIKIKPFSPRKPLRDITIPNIQIDDNLYNITTTPVEFIQPLILNGIAVLPISDKRPQPDKQKAMKESIEAKVEIESILEKDKAGNILPEQKEIIEEQIKETLKKVRFDELDVIMEKCKQDDYKDTNICKVIVDKESSRHIQRKYMANMLSLIKDNKDNENIEDND